MAKNVGKTIYAHWTTKVQNDAGWVYDGQPIDSYPEIMRYYTQGYIECFATEQIALTFLTAGASKYGQLPKIAKEMIHWLELARNGVVGVVFEGAKSARGALVATYLVHAAHAPSESWLRKMAQSPFKIDTYLKGTRFGNKYLDELFSVLKSKGIYDADRVVLEMQRTANFVPLRVDPVLIEIFHKDYFHVLAVLQDKIPSGSWIGTEGLVQALDRLIDPAAFDRTADFLRYFKTDTALGRDVAREALERFRNDTLAAAPGDRVFFKIPERISELYPKMYIHMDEGVFKYLSLTADGNVVLAAKRNNKPHWLSPKTATSRNEVKDLFQLPDRDTLIPPIQTARYRLEFETHQLGADIELPYGDKIVPAPNGYAYTDSPFLDPATLNNLKYGNGGGLQMVVRDRNILCDGAKVYDTVLKRYLTADEIDTFIKVMKTP